MKAAEQLRLEADTLAFVYDRGHVYSDVAAERYRAAMKHGSHSVELAPYDDHARWWPVVMEEVGEVARAFQESPERVHEELVQCAAMFCAWADAAGAALHNK